MKNNDLKNQAYDILREKLINCEYRPGSLLNETQLSTTLGFSRTPIREALIQIEREGYIRIIPKKGIYVTEISLNYVIQIFQARLEIEPITLRMAASSLPKAELLSFREKYLEDNQNILSAYQLDTAMHLFFIEHCGNTFIIDMMRKVFEHNTRVIISSNQNKMKIHDARSEHISIIDYVLDGKVKSAQEAMYNHVLNCKKAALDFFYNMQSFPDITNVTYETYLKKYNTLPTK